MHILRLLVILSTLSFFGCWDSSFIPIVKNVSGEDIFIDLVYETREKRYTVENRKNMVFPNLLLEERLKELRISSGNEEHTTDKNEMVYHLKAKNQIFIIQEGFVVKAEARE